MIQMKIKATVILIILILSSLAIYATEPSIPPEMLIPRTTIYGEVINSDNNLIKINKIVADCKKDSGIVEIEASNNQYANGDKVVIIAKKQNNKLIYDQTLDVAYYKNQCSSQIGSRLFTEIVKEEISGGTASEGYVSSDGKYTETSVGQAVQIKEFLLEQGADTKIPFKIKNNNDQAVKYKFKEFITYDLVKMNPGGFSEKPISERKDNAKVNFCTITFPRSEDVINAGKEKIFEITINCKDVSCVKPSIYNDRCEFTSMPTVEFITPFDEWAETSQDSYWNHNYYVKNEKEGESASNLGSKCSTSADCLNGLCLFCPSDTELKIQTDVDTYAISNCKYLKDKYGDKAQCQSEPNLLKISGGNQGYCGYGHTTTCNGNWNGDKYYINFFSLKEKQCAGPCVEADEMLLLVRFLTQDFLDVWKEEVLKMISKGYFESNFDVEYLEGQVNIKEDGNHQFFARIYYNFKFDWAKNERAGSGSTWESIKVAEKRNGKWEKVTKEEMISSYKAELERWHNLGKIRPTEYEIGSIIPKAEAMKKLKECHSSMEINNILIDSAEQKLTFYASGKIDLDTQNCENDPYNQYTTIIGMVNLQDGDVKCETHKSACAVFASESDMDKTESKQPKSVDVGSQKNKVGFFKRIANWFSRLFS